MIKRGASKWNIGDQVLAQDLNDTLGGRNVKVVTSNYTATMDDDVVVLKPSSSTNSYITITSGEYFYDKNAVITGGFAYQPSTSGGGGSGNGMLKINLSTYAVTVLATGFSANGYNCHVTDGSYIYFSNYSTSLQRYNIATPAVTTFATWPAAVYSICRDTAGNIYGQAYGGTIYKCTPGGVVTTYYTGGTWGSTVCAMICKNDGFIYITSGSASWKISTGGVSTALATTIPTCPLFYNSADESIYYRKQISGVAYLLKYDIVNDTEVLLTKAQYSGGTSCFTDGTYLFEGQSSGVNQFSRVLISTMIAPCTLTLPNPTTVSGKEILVTAPYGFTSSPFLAVAGGGKILIDVTPTNTDNFLTLPAGFPISNWGANNRTIKCISDGTNWLGFRH